MSRTTCLDCNVVCIPYKGGKCERCYRRLTRHRHRVCVHCGVKKTIQARGLCRFCWNRPRIREMYPVIMDTAPRREPTEEELDAIIAEQRKCLPADWYGPAWRD